MPTAFQRDSAVTQLPDIPGRYAAHIPNTWAAPNVPQGGIALATAVRAMQAEIEQGSDPGAAEMPLRSVSCVFAAPVAAGDIEIDVAVLRRGRSVAQATATMRTPGASAGLTAIAVFGATRPGFEFTDLDPPTMPDPETLPSFRDGPPEGVVFEHDHEPFPIWVHHLEGRPVVGHPPWDNYVPERSERQSFHRYDETPWRPDATMDPLALVTLCDTMPGAVDERMGRPHGFQWYGPSADLTVHIVGTARSEWLLMRNHARRASDGYASLDLELWDPETGLVAYGTQTMIFTFAGPEPVGEDRFPLDVRLRNTGANNP